MPPKSKRKSISEDNIDIVDPKRLRLADDEQSSTSTLPESVSVPADDIESSELPARIPFADKGKLRDTENVKEDKTALEKWEPTPTLHENNSELEHAHHLSIYGYANDPKKTPVYPTALRTFEEKLLIRILLIGNYASTKNSTFALEHLPDNIDWGTRRTLNNTSSLLCHGTNQTPITVWFVGRLLEFNYEKNGEPADMVGISFDPLMQGTANEAQKLLSKLCMPPARYADSWNDIVATCFQGNYRERGITKRMPFTSIFDARDDKKLHNDKSKMPSLPAKEIRVNDIIVVETVIRRYTKATDKTDSPWNSWKVKFELKCVSLLHKGFTADDDHEDVAI